MAHSEEIKTLETLIPLLNIIKGHILRSISCWVFVGFHEPRFLCDTEDVDEEKRGKKQVDTVVSRLLVVLKER